MRRSSATPRSAAVHTIHPTAIYHVEQLVEIFHLKRSTIGREAKLGRLKVAKRGNRYVVLGSWLLEWIESGVVVPNKQKQEMEASLKLAN